MWAKLGVLALMLVVLSAINPFYHPRPAMMAPTKLTPPVLGEYRASKTWTLNSISGSLESGATYLAAGRDPVQLDYFVGMGQAHNGVECFLATGETVLSEQLRPVKTASGLATFDVALLRSHHQLRLVAATECLPSGCTEQLSSPWSGHWVLPHLRVGIDAVEHSSAVPVSVMMTREDTSDVNASQRLFDQFLGVAGKLDLTLSPLSTALPQP